MNINRDYLIFYSPKNSEVTMAEDIFFYTSDKNTCNIYISIVGEYQDNLQLEVIIIPPNVTTREECYYITAKKLEDNKLYELEVPNTTHGKYQCEIKCISGGKLNTSDSFTYTVKNNLIK